ncbi:MAG: InlB B-repeat-containing protein [Treponema sp.]|nr:InlB B-repeat-containing protein [Treponema sp.]
MKRHSVFSILLALLACLLALGISLAACKNGTTDDLEPLPSVVYSNTAKDGSLYKLTITQKPARATSASNSFTPAQGDSYKLEIMKEEEVENTSIGTVQSIANDTFTLKPSNSDTTFSVKVTGGQIASVTGSIAVQGSDTPVMPASFAATTSSSGGGGGGGGGSSSSNSQGGNSQGGNSQGGDQGNTKTYTVTFNANGGTGTVTSRTVTIGSNGNDNSQGNNNNQGNNNSSATITLPSGDGLSKSGYTFGGWNTKTDGTGTNYAAGASYTVTASVTLYAKWIPVPSTFTITFDANGGSGAVPSVTASAGSSVTLPSGGGLSKNNYAFSGWNTESNGTGTNFTTGTSYTVTVNTTLYAKWVATTYTLFFNSNSGTGSVPNMTVNIGDSAILPSGNGLLYDGFIFVGWTGSYEGTGTIYSAGSSYTPTVNTMFYARWSDPENVGRDGTEGNPFHVYDIPTLQKVGSNRDGWTASAHYLQIKDIDLESIENWMNPWQGSRFSGVYDGGNYTISNLKSRAQGLFDGIIIGSSGVAGHVKNVKLENINITRSGNGGVAVTNDGTVEGCSVTGNVTDGNGVVGTNNGLVKNTTVNITGNNASGITGWNNGTVDGCSVAGNITGGSGVAASNYGTVTNCSVSANLSGTPDYIGGVVNYNRDGTVSYSYFTGTITVIGGVNGAVGGVVGNNSSQTASVSYCYSTSDISADANTIVGGVVGGGGGIITNCYSTGNISGNYITGGVVGVTAGSVYNCYATGDISGTIPGGVVGRNTSHSATISSCYATGNITSITNFYGGGVIADGGLDGSVTMNNVALNPSVTTTSTPTDLVTHFVARVRGGVYTEGALSNNYARANMSVTANGNSYTPVPGLDKKDGADITAVEWNSASWWQNTAQFPAGDWNFRAGLPTLRNMPGNPVQNPVVK